MVTRRQVQELAVEARNSITILLALACEEAGPPDLEVDPPEAEVMMRYLIKTRVYLSKLVDLLEDPQ